MAKVKQVCEKEIAPIIEDLGYDLIEVSYQKLADGMNLIFTIDSDNGITIDDCEKVSKVIDPILDKLNPTEDQPYILSVSSPGIDRPLKTERDFKRNLEKEIELTLFKKIDGKKTFVGILKTYDDNEITIDENNKLVTLKRKDIAQIQPVIKF